MAEETNTSFTSEQDEESRREQQDSQASEKAQQNARDAQDLDAEEFSQTPPEAGYEEQPFGNRKDDTSLVAERTGAALEPEDEPQAEPEGERFLPGTEQEMESGRRSRGAFPETDTDSAAGTQPLDTGSAAPSADAPPPESNAVLTGDNAEFGDPGTGTGEDDEDGTPDPAAAPAAAADTPDEAGGETDDDEAGDPAQAPAEVAAAQAEDTETEDTPPVAQTPALSLNPAQGLEDGAIALDISAFLQDTDQGGESLSLRISNVPAGATLSAGTDLGGGVWQLTPDQLPGLTITPPPDSNEDFTLTVTATSTESTGETASVTAQLPVDVVGVADAPLLTAELVPGPEDTAVDLNITGSLTDTDGSETLSYVISDMPDGSVLSAGTDNGDGTWTLTPDDLDGLQYTPPPHHSGDITFNVAAVSTENDGDTASTPAEVTATFSPVADAPTVEVGNVTGPEDTGIVLDLGAALVDPSETLSVTISGVPDGAVFSAGTKNADGTWSIDPADLPGLTVTPPDDFSGDMAMTITAVSTESDGTTASTSHGFNVHVTGVADTPDLAVTPATGAEDTAVPLSITPGLTDTDGSETLTVTITGIPPNFSLSAGTLNQDGSVTLTPAQLSGLTISGPQDYSGTFDLTVTATSAEHDGDTADNIATLPVTFTGVADTPDAAANPAQGTEDTPLPLNLSAAATDIDGSENITAAIITGVPAGFTLTNATDNQDGTWTVTDPTDLGNVSLNAPEHYSGSVALGLTVTATDTGGDTATTSVDFTANFSPVPDAPNVAATNVSGDEDTPISLNLSSSLVDGDGSESLGVVISGVPAGATLSHGTPLGNGQFAVSLGDLPNLAITPPDDFSGDIPMQIISTATESDGNTATTTVDFNVHVTGVADDPVLTAELVNTPEDSNMDLNITGTLTDDTRESLTYAVTGVPANFTLTAGDYDDTTDTWNLSTDDLDGLQLVPPADWSGTVDLNVSVTSTEEDGDTATVSADISGTFIPVADAPLATAQNLSGDEDSFIPFQNFSSAETDIDGSETLSAVITGVPAGSTLTNATDMGDGKWEVDPDGLNNVSIKPPANFSGTMNLTLSVTSTDGTDTATTNAPFTVTVDPVADAPDLSTSPLSGLEDVPLELGFTSALTDSTETLSLTVTGLPDGFELSAGTYDSAAGTWTLAPGDLDGLTMSAVSNQDYKGDFNLTVTATSTESDGETASVTHEVPVHIEAVADAPALAATPAQGTEDTAVDLHISTNAVDAKGTETITGVIITGVPAGATLSAGVDMGNGRWELTTDDLAGLKLNPPADSNVDFTLTVTSISEEPNGSRAQSTTTLDVDMVGDADTPSLTVQDTTGNEDAWINLAIGGDLADIDSSETHHFEISGLPSGAYLNHGTEQSDGTWILSPDDLAGLKIKPGRNDSRDFTLEVKSVSTENDGDVASVTDTIDVTVMARADKAKVGVGSNADRTGTEDTDLALNLSASVKDTGKSDASPDQSEQIDSARITGVPEGFTVNGGTLLSTDPNTGESVWDIPTDQLDSITLSPPEHYSGQVDLRFEVTTIEPENGAVRTTPTDMPVWFEAVADAPDISTENVDTLEDTPVRLELSAALVDTDTLSAQPETMVVTVSGVPEGATLSHGTPGENGTWTVDAADLPNLELTPPLHFSGDINLTLTATSTETSNNDSATSTENFTVHVEGVADTPNLAVMDAIGNEDNTVPLVIRASLVDTDGSESLFVDISGVPAGGSITGGVDMGGGTWRVPAADLPNAAFEPPLDSNEDYTFTVRSLAVETDGDQTYSAPETIDVNLRGVPDEPDVFINGEQLDDTTFGGTVTGDEDTAIPLSFHADSTDIDPSETISYVITGVPQGASLSTGVFIGNGRWSVGEDDMPGLTITPPNDFSGNIDLGITVVVQENDGRESSHPYTLTVQVDPVVDDPARGGLDGPESYGRASGTEDTAIALNLDPGLRDDDPSETTLWVEITDIPDGAVLSSYGTEVSPGVYRYTPAEYQGLTITPPHDSGDDFTINVRAMIQDVNSDTTAVSEGPLKVVVRADADEPTLEAGDISGKIGQVIPADISSELTDTDDSESLDFIISGLEGTQIVPTSGINLGGGMFLVSGADLATLGFTQEGGKHVKDLEVKVHAVSTENEGDQTYVTDTFTITTTPGGGGSGGGNGGGTPADPTDPPSLVFTAPEGDEDTPFDVSITPAFDPDASQFGIILSNLPSGAQPNMGYYNPINNTWVINTDDPNVSLADLEIQPPHNFAGPMDFTVTLAQTGADGATQETTTTITANIDPVVDSPSIGLADSSGTEDTPLTLGLKANPTDNSEDVVSVSITNVPAGASLALNGVTLNPTDGRYDIDPADLADVQFIPPEHQHGSFSFTVEAVVEESDGTQATFTRNLGVNFTASTDPAVLTTADAAGFEDGTIALNLSASLIDNDGSEVMAVTISNVPTDALFSAGSNNGDGSWTFTPAQLSGLTFTPPPGESGDWDMTLNAYTMEKSTGEVVTTSATFNVEAEGVADKMPVDSQDSRGDEDTAIPVTIDYIQVDTDGSETVTAVLTGFPAGTTFSHGDLQPDGVSWLVQGTDLDNLTVTPPADFSGDMNIHADVITTEADGDSATSATDFTVTVDPIADAPDLAPQDAAGDEDTEIPLDFGAVLTDATEVLQVVVSNLPDGATLSAGTDNGDGTWTLTSADLADVKLIPAEHQSGDFTLNVVAESTEPETGETAETTGTLDLTIEAVADPVTVTVHNTSGAEDTEIPVDVDYAHLDTDGSETVTSITVSGVPQNASLNAGSPNPDGTWTIPVAALSALAVTPPADFSGTINLSLAFLNEEADGDSLVTTADVTITVTPEADAPDLTVQDASGDEDQPIDLDIQTVLTDATETLGNVVISGIPADAELSAGTNNHDGTWTLSPDDLAGLTITPPPDSADDFELTVTSYSTEGGTEASSTASINVTVAGVIDDPTFAVEENASGTQGEPVDLDIDAQPGADGETMSLTISGLPDNASLSAGTGHGDGTWTLDSSETTDLQLTLPDDFTGSLDLNVAAVVEQEGSTLELNQSMSVDVAAAPPQPVTVGAYAALLSSDGSPQLNSAPSPAAMTYISDFGIENTGQDDGNGNGLTPGAQNYADEFGLQSDQTGIDAANQAQFVEQTVNGNSGVDSDLDSTLNGEADLGLDAGQAGLDLPLPEPTADDPAQQGFDQPQPTDIADLNQDI